MNDFEKVWNFESLYRAYMKARRGKRWKGAAAKFEVNLLEALNLLSEQLKSKTYRLSPYNTFKVYEPKERVVMSNSYKDKVVQHALATTFCNRASRRRSSKTTTRRKWEKERISGLIGWKSSCAASTANTALTAGC